MSIARKTRGIHRLGTRADQPAATAVLEGTLYWVTDELLLERSNGATWDGVSITGEKTDIAFDAGLFTANGGGTWTVASGDVETLAYTRLGSGLVLFQYGINTSSVSGSPTQLIIEVPFTAAVAGQNLGRYFDLGALTADVQNAVIGAGTDSLLLIKLDSSAWPTRTNEIYVFGELLFFI